jgi:hypothetical protein
VVMHTRYELRARWLKPIRYFIERVVKTMHAIVILDMRLRLGRAVSSACEDGAIRRRLSPG